MGDFAFQRLDVYRAAIQFRQCVERVRRGSADLRDELERASNSIICNVAEGAGRMRPAEKRHFYELARGSACECVGAIDGLVAIGALGAAEHAQALDLLVRIGMMLSALIRRFASAGKARSASRSPGR